MKYFCYTNIRMTNSRKDLVYMMHPRVKNILHGLDELMKLEEGSIVAFDDILELDPSGNNNIETIKRNYIELWNRNLELCFDRSPSLNSEIVAIYEEDFGLDNLLNLKINDYLNIKNSMVNMKQYSQKKVIGEGNKSYGRPRGTKRESAKAIATKEIILKESKDFGGSKNDTELIEQANVSRRSYYLYKNELLKEKESKASKEK